MLKRVVVLLLICLPITAIAEVKTSVRFVSCAAVDTIVTVKEVCYIYDLQRKEAVVQVTFAAGVNVNAGTVVFGGSAKAVLEAIMEFPIDSVKDKTNEQIASEAAAEFTKVLAKADTAKKAKEALGEEVFIFDDFKTNACYAKAPDDELEAILKLLEK